MSKSPYNRKRHCVPKSRFYHIYGYSVLYKRAEKGYFSVKRNGMLTMKRNTENKISFQQISRMIS